MWSTVCSIVQCSTTVLQVCCLGGFGLGLFYVTPGGQIMLEMVDYYGGTILILGTTHHHITVHCNNEQLFSARLY